jgi:integrase
MPATALRLHTRDARKKLRSRDKPYFLELHRGLALGYRRGSTGGSWLLREFRADAAHKAGGRYIQRRLGLADDDGPADGRLSYEAALALAVTPERPTVTKPGKYTVAQAAEAYFDVASKRHDVARDRVTYAAAIADQLGTRPVAELTAGDLNKWLADQVPETADRELRRRKQATANRHWNLLRAMLNAAYHDERVPSADAWARVKPYRDVDRARTRNLTADEARALLGKLESPLLELARGSLLTGLRLGELQALRVEDVAEGAVSVRHSKSGDPRRVPLTGEGAKFFAKLTADAADGALLFGAVSRIAVSRGMRRACVAAKIPPARFHDLRRSYGSLLLNAGAAPDTIRRLLGHADMRMTLRNYAHLADEAMQTAVDQHLPSFEAKPARRRRGKRNPGL